MYKPWFRFRCRLFWLMMGGAGFAALLAGCCGSESSPPLARVESPQMATDSTYLVRGGGVAQGQLVAFSATMTAVTHPVHPFYLPVTDGGVTVSIVDTGAVAEEESILAGPLGVQNDGTFSLPFTFVVRVDARADTVTATALSRLMLRVTDSNGNWENMGLPVAWFLSELNGQARRLRISRPLAVAPTVQMLLPSPALGNTTPQRTLTVLEKGDGRQILLREVGRSGKQVTIEVYVVSMKNFSLVSGGYVPSSFQFFVDGVSITPSSVEGTTGLEPATDPIDATNDFMLVIDRSGSMGWSVTGHVKLDVVKSVVDSFLSVLNTAQLNARVGLLSFSSDVVLNHDLTNDFQSVLQAVQNLTAGGGTAIYDAVYQAVAYLRQEAPPPSRPYLYLFTDGQENSSMRTLDDVRQAFEGLPAPFFVVGTDDADVASLYELAACAEQGKVLYLSDLYAMKETLVGLATQAYYSGMRFTFDLSDYNGRVLLGALLEGEQGQNTEWGCLWIDLGSSP